MMLIRRLGARCNVDEPYSLPARYEGKTPKVSSFLNVEFERKADAVASIS